MSSTSKKLLPTYPSDLYPPTVDAMIIDKTEVDERYPAEKLAQVSSYQVKPQLCKDTEH